MNKNPVVALSPVQRRELFELAERAVRLPAVMIEKDFWVCWTLQNLFALPGARDHFIFKGGTSLSKVWQAIRRFSEDIDISLSREWLGFGGKRDPEVASSRNKRSQLLDELSEACAIKLRDDVAPALRRAFTDVLGTEGWSLTVDTEDPQTLLFAYSGALADAPVGAYVQRAVRVECGARSDRWPIEIRRIVPYVAEAFPDAFGDAAFELPVLSIERTFWEKATILHAEAHHPADKEVPARFSRHYADLAALAGHEAGRRALNRDDLRARVVTHKQVFFASSWAHYETAVPGQFRLIPSDERLASLAGDYQAMKEMFFETPPPWAEIVKTLTQLEKAINGSRV